MKWYLLWLMIFVAGVSAILYLPRVAGNSATQAAPPVPLFDKDRAWEDLLAQVRAGFRIPGTPAHLQVRDWLVKRLAESAGTVQTQPFSHRLGGREVKMWNIITTYPGTGTAPRQRVLLAAHWDSRPTADQDPDPANRSLPVPAANDGASGVAVLLEIGRQLKRSPVARDVDIVLFDGEDYGPKVDNMLLGSKYYAQMLRDDRPAWGILLDMIGKTDVVIPREPNSEQYAKAVNDRVFQAARALGYLRAGDTGFRDSLYKYPIEDDHMPLNHAGVPTADLIDFEYPAWHTRNDTPEQCSADSLALVGKTVLYALR